ncbi:MAG: hypothetical protein Q7R65_03715 [bacterium]|nr:hypothetical protein [bacterium]
MTQDQLEKLALFHTESQRQNIVAIRNWIFQLTIMSGGVIGFTLPILSTSSLIKNGCFLIGGLFLLWIEIVLGFGYLHRILSRENIRLAEQAEELKKSHGVKSEMGDTKSSILDVLYGLFIIATLLIILSMVDF